MKKYFLLILLLPFYFQLTSQTLPNNSFESWKTNTFPNYEEPEPWNTPNPYTSLAGQICVSSSDDAVEGNFSARMETVEISVGPNTFQSPGLVTYADFNVNVTSGEYTFSGGVLLQQRVSKLKGKYKYTGVEGDSASALIYCFKHPEGSEIDTIGVGLVFLHDAAEWTDFSVDMLYFSTALPDTFNVLLMSTGTFEIGYMPPGSVLYVDDLSLDISYDFTPENNLPEAHLYPVPAGDHLTFDLGNDQVTRILTIYDVNGQLVTQTSLNGSNPVFYSGNLTEGIYLYRIKENKILKYAGSFIKQ